MKSSEQLWKYRIFGEQNPESLLYALWNLLTLYSDLRGCQEHHEMLVKDFSLNKDDQGTEYVTFEENRRKTCQGDEERSSQFANEGPRFPVQFLKTYLAHRPEEMQKSDTFYLAIIEKEIRSVYKKQRMGVNKIDSLEAELDIKVRKLTVHSESNTLVNKLKASNQPRSAIIDVTGHTRELSLADYEEGEEAEERQVSSIISSPVRQQVQNSRPVLFMISLLIQDPLKRNFRILFHLPNL